MRAPPAFEVLLVTPEGVSRDDLARVLGEGARVLGAKLAVQARAKASHAALVRIVDDVAELAATLGIPWFVNGDPVLAVERGAHLHVPGDRPREGLREKMQDAWISSAAHRDDDVVAAMRAGFDAALVSPIFEVPGKGPARGVEAIGRARALSTSLHVVALGGVGVDEAAACFAAGADAVAVMRAPFAERSFFARVAERLPSVVPYRRVFVARER